MRSALSSINKRIDDLQALDPSTMTRWNDPQFWAVEDRINQTLADIVGDDSTEYRRFRAKFDATVDVSIHTPRDRWVKGYQDGITISTEKLKSLKQLIEERLAEPQEAQEVAPQPQAQGRNVFIVHGHDEAAKQEVARFLERLKLKPVVLHEQPNLGRTIIEKLEKHVAEARFAVILLTPDDFGYAAGHADSPKPRARQNVVLELGIFLAALGRQNVVALVKGDVEFPSDLYGVIYERMDAGGGWKLRIAGEIKASGIDVDLNLAIG